MDSIGTALRRTILLIMLAAGIGAALAWRQGRTTPTPTAAPVWPPLPSDPPDDQPAAPPDAEPAWVPGNDDGTTPTTHPIKAKDSSGIFHQPGGRFYDRTKPDRCYPTAAAAEADGYRRSKS
jgi:hypothetical protein